LIAAFLAEGFFQHSQLSEAFHLRVWEDQADFSSLQNALYMACLSGLGFLFAAVFLGRTGAWAVLRNEAPLGETLGCLGVCLATVYLTRRLNLALFPEDPAILQRQLLEGSLLGYLKSCLAAWGLPPTLLLVSILVPFYEEVAFRGVLLQSAGKYFPFWVAGGLQAAAFASLHEGWRSFPTYFAMGLILAWAARRTKGLLVPMLAHAVNNMIAVTSLWLLVRHLPR
jgi:membrane protease YdiL (CAAX protease family)